MFVSPRPRPHIAHLSPPAPLQTSQSTLLLKKKKEMREVDESLELMKKDHKRRMDICEQRRIRFEEKQAKMREQVLKFEKFIQENDAKRIRAELKAKQERKSYEEKVREIASLNDEIKRLELDQKRLDSELSMSSAPAWCRLSSCFL